MKDQLLMTSREKFCEIIDEVFSKYTSKRLMQYYNSTYVEEYSYLDMKNRMEKMAKSFLTANLKCGNRIALLADLSPYSIQAMLACVYAGLTITIIDPKLPEQEMRRLIDLAEIQVFVIDANKLSFIEKYYRGRIVFDVKTGCCISEKISLSESHMENEIDKEAIAILFSSGTTSQAKGVVIGYEEQLKSMEYQKIIWNDKMRYLFLFPVYHISGFSTFWGCFFSGGELALLKEVNIENIQKVFVEFRPILFGMIPKVYDNFKGLIESNIRVQGKKREKIISKIMNMNGWTRRYLRLNFGKIFFRKVYRDIFGGELKLLGVGGGILKQETYEFFYKLGFTWINIYASTEMNVPISTTDTRYQRWNVTVGRKGTFNGIDIKVLNMDKQGIGELAVKSPLRFRNYFKDADTTEQAFIDGYFKTGDIGYIDKKGYIYITGRLKESIHLKNGEKVAPEDIEKIYANELKNYNYACCGIQCKGEAYDAVHMFIEGISNKYERNRIQTILQEKNGNYHIKKVHYVDKIPVTSVGKVKRYMLKDLIKDDIFADETLSSERFFQDIVSDIIGRQIYDVDWNKTLLELGLDSLDLMELSVSMETIFGFNVDKISIEALTLRDISMVIEEKSTLKEKRNNGSKIYDKLIRIILKPIVLQLFHPLYLHRENVLHHERVIFAPNHRKTSDAFLMVAGIKMRVHWVALKRFFTGEDSIFNNNKNFWLRSITKFVLRKMEMIPIDREGDNTESIRKMCYYISQGDAVGIFPEGTTNKHPDLYELGILKKGAFQLAILYQAVIQPISIVWCEHHRNKVVINFCEPIFTNEIKNVNELMSIWEDKILKGILECKQVIKSDSRNRH